jgi:hypothetical protein
MRGLPTIFGSEKLVSPEMTDEKLRQIAGDNPKSRQSRLQLKEKTMKLKEAYSKIDSLLRKFENSAVGTSSAFNVQGLGVCILLTRSQY